MRIVVLVGLPASGKSKWLSDNNLPALSSDALRETLTGDATHQGVNRLIFSTLRHLCAMRNESGCAVTYVDSTALTRWERRCWVRFSELHGCEIECVFFDVPLDECKRRNAARDRQVPEPIMDLMAAKLVPPETSEGFARVTVIRQGSS